MHLYSDAEVNGRGRIGFYLDPILTPAEDTTGCRRHIDAIVNVWLNDLDRPLRTRSLSTRIDESSEQFGWPDCVERRDLDWSAQIVRSDALCFPKSAHRTI